ncbi:TPA: DarT ssDNA thymidine ADP-ribosyltransferase family protein [Escherichia coli]|uniref:DarT ssDNA thymidine ADP-ribosyltransferase family protein n=1 Tax=Escherichia coli TaxID=562 RepID=UPI0007A5CA47|nr:DarT ssDNA thymidine ADP-ribosyltransferase family protein [Escherichia coli]EEW2303802.1 DUF4433 domain-containing protein [Escherichia coli]EFB8334795.1 DUF4433 domain-containing protein [Escherichia coli]EFK0448281.1 DUF4433 domain-containing protein [Escherichia coli]EFO2713822.1 DUF4433 domain-containing protein [Escherichia coli]EGQ2048982.1 DUF4433 domain-containing protein [Escherichia coli]
MVDIRTQQFLYHLTDVNNLGEIFSEGLKSRSLLRGFSDVADPEIIALRRALRLEEFVPFHFFAKNPFDGRVHLDNPDKKFALITVRRSHAQANNWRIIPRHPLSGTAITLLNYEAGMDSIDWVTMNLREYDNDECRRICMAECLSPETVPARDFFSIYVPDSVTENAVNTLKQRYGFNMYVNNSPNMFPGV